MFALLTALALAGSPAPAPSHQAAAEEQKDPIVCKGNRWSRSLGSNMIRGRTCKRKSEWERDEKHSQRELKSATDKWTDPTPVPGARP